MGYRGGVDCICFKGDGYCLHQAAPRRLFGAARCILENPTDDPRVLKGCALQVRRARPKGPPPAPGLRKRGS